MKKITYPLISSAALYLLFCNIAFAAVPGAPTLSAGSKYNQFGALMTGVNVLNWTVPNDGGQTLTYYKIYRGTAPGTETFLTQINAASRRRTINPGIRAPKPEPFAELFDFSIKTANAQTTPATSYIDNIGTGYDNRKPWYYRISAVNAAGEGPLSNEITDLPITSPLEPRNIIAVPGEGQIALSWDPPADNGGSPLVNGTADSGPYLYKIFDGNGNLRTTSLANSAIVKLYGSELKPPIAAYLGISAHNAVGDGKMAVAYATGTPLTGRWVDVPHSCGNYGETADSWLSRIGQTGKRNRVVQYMSWSGTYYYDFYGVYLSSSGSWGTYCQTSYDEIIGPSNINGNTLFINQNGGGTYGANLLASYGLNFYPATGYTLNGTQYDYTKIQILTGTGPAAYVAKAGTGSGTVTGVGINCGPTCSANYVYDDSYSFTAAPDANSVFTGWSGDCASAGSNLTCTLAMDTGKNIVANFSPKPAILAAFQSGDGSGKIASSPAGLDCPPTCTVSYAKGTSVTLTASPDTYSEFSNWSGDCTGSGVCNLIMNAAKTVTANFTKKTSKVGPGGVKEIVPR